eukprot:2419992-Pyramimonas_sp.AAC.1
MKTTTSPAGTRSSAEAADWSTTRSRYRHPEAAAAASGLTRDLVAIAATRLSSAAASAASAAFPRPLHTPWVTRRAMRLASCSLPSGAGASAALSDRSSGSSMPGMCGDAGHFFR